MFPYVLYNRYSIFQNRENGIPAFLLKAPSSVSIFYVFYSYFVHILAIYVHNIWKEATIFLRFASFHSNSPVRIPLIFLHFCEQRLLFLIISSHFGHKVCIILMPIKKQGSIAMFLAFIKYLELEESQWSHLSSILIC